MAGVSIEEARRHLEAGGMTVLDARPHSNAAAAAETVKAAGIAVEMLPVDLAAFEAYLAEVDYQKTFPRYCAHFSRRDPSTLKRKFFEQYISIEAVKPKAVGVYMDVAAAGGPWVDIVRDKYGATTYAQDLRFEQGVHDGKVGSNADDIPLPDGSLDGIVSLNAIEHFEAGHDLGFLKECARLLKPGGVLCIVPYVPVTPGYSVTAPAKWESRSEIDPERPTFDSRLPVVLDEDSRQRCIKVPSPESFIEDAQAIPEIEWRLVVLKGLRDLRFQRSMLVGVRKA